MEIIFLPFLIGALIISILAIIQSYKLIKTKIVGLREILLGLLSSIIIYGFIAISYKLQGKALALGPSFRLPFFMIYIPYSIYLIIRITENNRLRYISSIIILSVAITGFLELILHNTYFGLLDNFRN